MSKDYEIIIIGSGVSGLSVGALLVNAGKRVLILEEGNRIGGRNFTINYKGYELNNGGHAVIGGCERGYLGEVYAKVGKKFPEYMSFGSGMFIVDGERWRDIREIYQHDEFRRICNDIMSMSDEEIDRYDDVSAKTWLMKRTKDEGMHKLFWVLLSAFMGGNKYESIAASEGLYTFKDFLEKKGQLNPALIIGGFSKLNEPLAEAITEKGGEIRLNAKVLSVIVEDRKVCGVQVEGEKGFPSQLSDNERIEAPVVVSTIPVPYLFEVVAENNFPSWYVSWITSLKGKSLHVWTLYAGMDEPLFSDTKGRHIFGMPGLEGLTVIAYMPSVIAPGFAPEGKHLFEALIQGNDAELPERFVSASDLCQAMGIFERLEAGLEELYPGFERSCNWKMRLPNSLGVPIEPGFVGKYRPDMQPPEVEALYLCSDHARICGIGVNGAAHSALLVAQKILEQT